jgi:hypothetical protein
VKTYTLTHAAYGQEAGTTLALDDTDPLVQMNVENGVLVPGKDQTTVAQKMTCPICDETMTRPPRFENADLLAAHYEEKHAGFVVPAWQADKEDDEA